MTSDSQSLLVNALSSAGFTAPNYLPANGAVRYQSATYIACDISVLQNAIDITYINVETGQPTVPDVAIAYINDVVTEL